ncbi:MAG: peptidylprolyl isomerase [Egibacteraceae bacterium]
MIGLVLTACGGLGGGGIADVAATVNGVTISMADFQDRLELLLNNPQIAQQVEGDGESRRQVETQILTRMVEVALLDQAARDINVSVSDEELEARLSKEISDQFGSRERYEELLGQQGLTDSHVRVQLRALMLGERIQERIGEEVSAADISAEDVQSAYEEQFSGDAPIARHILLESEEEAVDVMAQLRDGAAFADLARDRSTDRTSAGAGGLVGQVVPGQLVAEFEKAVDAAADGEIVGPVETQYGFHVIQRLGPRPPHSQVDASIRERLLERRRAQVFEAFVQEQRDKSAVEVNPRFGQWDPETGHIVPAQQLGAQPEG